MTKREQFIACLRTVAYDLLRYAHQIESTGHADRMGELEPPPMYLSVEIQSKIHKYITKEPR